MSQVPVQLPTAFLYGSFRIQQLSGNNLAYRVLHTPYDMQQRGQGMTGFQQPR